MTSQRTRDVVVGLGSNLGDRFRNLSEAIAMLHDPPAVRVVAVSPVYETDAVGPPQPAYLNAAARIETGLPLDALLSLALSIERERGRVRRVRWGPRTLDLDVLWAEEGHYESPGLTVPHPRLWERAFALAPLLDVLPEAAQELRERLAALGGAPPRFTESLEPPK